MACPKCFSGHKHDGETLGKEEKIHGLDTYVTEGINPKAILIYVPDAFGWKFNNARILADHYASRIPARVYVAEFMDGVPIPEWMLPVLPNIKDLSLSITNWLLKPYYIAQLLYGGIPFMIYNRLAVSHPRVKNFVTAVRESQDPAEKDLPIGVVGFCWGGKHVTLLSAKDAVTPTGKPLVDATFTGHPSMLSLPADIEPIARPYSVAIGDKDMMLDIKGIDKLKSLLEAKPDVPSEVTVYEGAEHGFCVRENIAEGGKLLQNAIDSEDQAVKWFQTHLK